MIVDTRPDTPTSDERTDTVLLVRLGDQQYGLPITAVERVLPMAYVIPLPDGTQGLLGMLNLHGQVLPVVDPRPHLGLPNPAPAADHRLVLLTGAQRFLLWVDSVEEVVACAPDAWSDAPGMNASPLVRWVLRLGEAVVPLLVPGALEPRRGRP